MSKIIIALLCGVIFGLGLSLSQMVNPNKVLAFLDISGNWDPSLAFVMMGALAVALPAFRFIQKRRQPVFEDGFHVTHKTAIDKPLLSGAAIFGIGWGMSGYCPGPAVTSLGFGSMEGLVMVAGIYAGFFAERFFAKK
ncbi:DUF6691 family protein [Methylomarinum vadi]|uniref:DUF6691 family protein n=1 Tax=Methylomarinum vadi TaxID=438855 RepID=UPI0004DF3C4A|nr:DUF6691 family protein [Methylomarinum vadi]